MCVRQGYQHQARFVGLWWIRFFGLDKKKFFGRWNDWIVALKVGTWCAFCFGELNVMLLIRGRN